MARKIHLERLVFTVLGWFWILEQLNRRTDAGAASHVVGQREKRSRDGARVRLHYAHQE